MKKLNAMFIGLCSSVILSACGGGGSSALSGGETTSAASNPKVMQALAAIQGNPQLWAAVKGHRISMKSNLSVAGVGKAACAAHKDTGIVLNTEYINERPMSTAAACILHEALHLNAGHVGQSAAQESQATAFARNGLKTLGL